MTNIKFTLLLFILLSATTLSAQQTHDDGSEKYGHTLNLGLGLGYYGYIGHSTLELMLNYEIDVARSFTLAPSIGLYTYSENYYYGNPHNGYYYYTYHETDIPIGLKGTYYFDRLLNASPAWDFYLAGSLGFDIISAHWDNGYSGDRNVYQRSSPLYLDAHIGTEYHFNRKLGMFLDLSTGVSTIGLAFHK